MSDEREFHKALIPNQLSDLTYFHLRRSDFLLFVLITIFIVMIIKHSYHLFYFCSYLLRYLF